MKIYIKGNINKNYLAIDTIDFITQNGTIFTVDRTSSEYTIDENGMLDMTWKCCYLRAVNGCHIFSDEVYLEGAREFEKLVKGAKVRVNIEEDADKDYKVSILAWSIR